MPRDLYEVIGPPDDNRARQLVVLLSLLPDSADDREVGADAA